MIAFCCLILSSVALSANLIATVASLYWARQARRALVPILGTPVPIYMPDGRILVPCNS